MKVAFLNNSPGQVDRVYGQGRREKLARVCELLPGVYGPGDLNKLHDVEAIFSTWGMPRLTGEQLDALPKLRAVFYAAGAVAGFAEPLLLRGVRVFSAWRVNAIPVAEFSYAQILLSCKGYFRNIREYRAGGRAGYGKAFRGPGLFDVRIAVVGDGSIGSLVRDKLKAHHVEVLFVQSKPDERDVSMAEAFATSFVVSNHLPNRDDNQRVFDAALFRSMPEGATFINTGRGAQVNKADLIAVFRERPDLTALLDVTDPHEPVWQDDELLTLPNVIVSTHIAGSINHEVLRMGDAMIEEFAAWSSGGPLRYEVDLPTFHWMARG